MGSRIAVASFGSQGVCYKDTDVMLELWARGVVGHHQSLEIHGDQARTACLFGGRSFVSTYLLHVCHSLPEQLSLLPRICSQIYKVCGLPRWH